MDTPFSGRILCLPVLAAGLAGCPWIGPGAADARFDVDGDGVPYPDDCDEGDALVFPGAVEACNGVDDDCDGAPGADELDGDADGVRGCEGDCDDASADVSPDKVEVCGNGIDEDCDPDPTACRWSQGEPLTASERIAGDAEGFGYSVAAGDWNGDGVEDLAVGSPIAMLGLDQVGAVHLFPGPLGVADHNMLDAEASMYGPQANALAGFAVANGGGADDSDLVVATAPQWYDGTSPRGAALRASSQVGISTLTPILYGTQELLGVGLASLGDPDGDGYNTMATTQAYSIVLFDLLYEPPIRPMVRMWTTCDRNTAIANAGDLDGDGVSDLLLGQATCGDNSGDVYVIDGAQIVDNVAVDDHVLTRLRGGAAGGLLGYALSGGRDVTGDGTADFVAAELQGGPAGSDVDGAFTTSAVWVVAGRSTYPAQLLQADADALIAGPAVRYHTVYGVNAATDLDGDGIGDVLVGVPSFNSSTTGSGAVGVFYGPFAGTVAWDAVAARFEGPDAGAAVGQSFAALGDVNGDGAEDLAVGSANFSMAGSAYILLGRAQ